MTWTCHAKPVALGGKTCGHVNTGPSLYGHIGNHDGRFECCKGCGCTRKASELRQAKINRK